MPKFYITYPLGSPLQDNFSIVEAKDSTDAELLVEQAGVKMGCAYAEAFFSGMVQRYGLKEITIAQAKKALPL